MQCEFYQHTYLQDTTEEEVLKMDKNFPYLAILRVEKVTFWRVVERQLLITTENFDSAILYLFAAYAFNIQYPKLP